MVEAILTLDIASPVAGYRLAGGKDHLNYVERDPADMRDVR